MPAVSHYPYPELPGFVLFSVPYSHLAALHGKDWTVNNDALI